VSRFPGGRMDLRRLQPLPDLMASVASQHSTGILTSRSDEAVRELIFVNGELRAARSDIEKEKLGSWLVERGIIDENDRALTLLVGQGSAESPPLGHLLVTRGHLDQETLEQELATLATTIVHRAAAAPSSFSEFNEGATTSHPDTLPGLTTTELILLAARSYPNVDHKRTRLGPLRQVAWPAVSLETLLDELPLEPPEAFVLSRLDGTRRLDELVSMGSVSEDETISILYTLHTAGIISIGDAPAASLAPMPSIRTESRESAQLFATVDESLLGPDQLAERERVVKLAGEAPRMDHYRALGLEQNATVDEIEKAWRKVQRRFSPERSSEAHLKDLRRQLQIILERASEAHEVLSTTASKHRYDQVLKSLEKERTTRTKQAQVKNRIDADARSQLVEANLKRADELIHDGEPYLALQLLEQACKLDPQAPALVKLARLQLRNPLWKSRALKTLRWALEVDPKFVDAWLELAEFWRRSNNPERQRKALERALAADPEHPKAVQMYRQLVGHRDLERLIRRARSRRR